MGIVRLLKKLFTKRLHFFGDIPQEHSIGTNATIWGINQSMKDWRVQLQYIDLEGERKWYDKVFVWPLYLAAYAFIVIMSLRSGNIFDDIPEFQVPRRLKTILMMVTRVLVRIFYFLLLIVICIGAVIGIGYLVIRNMNF